MNTKKERQKAIEHFEMKVYRKFLGSVYDNKKENWKLLNNKEIYASVRIAGETEGKETTGET